jgi:hypothetical protein
MTYKQASTLSGKVRKGETGTLVVYDDRIIRKETNSETGGEAERAIPFMKGYTVFNVEQIDGLPAHYYGRPEPRFDGPQRIDHAEAFFATTGAEILSTVGSRIHRGRAQLRAALSHRAKSAQRTAVPQPRQALTAVARFDARGSPTRNDQRFIT